MKISHISSLAKNLALSLSVSSVRIIEVIPGKPVVRLTTSNKNRKIVRLREMFGCLDYKKLVNTVSDSPRKKDCRLHSSSKFIKNTSSINS
ncbi:MAG: hypothetical protein HRT91_03255 [Piscirickettsiaceae bacterium]|nr:hypothetical protein [Piscirickettsiaceae bacterium]